MNIAPVRGKAQAVDIIYLNCLLLREEKNLRQGERKFFTLPCSLSLSLVLPSVHWFEAHWCDPFHFRFRFIPRASFPLRDCNILFTLSLSLLFSSFLLSFIQFLCKSLVHFNLWPCLNKTLKYDAFTGIPRLNDEISQADAHCLSL